MKAPEEIRAVFLDMIAHLPTYIDPARVTCCSGRFRVYLDGCLISEWGHGVCGWLPVESCAYLGHDGRTVDRVMRRAMKAAP